MLTKPILAKLDDSGATVDVAPIINDACGLALPVCEAADRVAELAAAIGDVETCWGWVRGARGTTGAAIIGDDESGNGYMQIDAHAHPDLVAEGKMLNPTRNIHAGVAILTDYMHQLADLSEEAQVGSYNCGTKRMRRCIEAGGKPDDVTERNSYCARVDHALRTRGFAPLATVAG